ncbi:hypothetical protein RND81_05G223500 [Saponaria officinalis]|uniref:Uncharacterized protein n=1 Tax=Saponaria officinalis TaxID=3572 RepID=A0AAW1L0K0_SAPOF
MVKNPKRKTIENTEENTITKKQKIIENNNNKHSEKERRMMVKLYCPKISKICEIMTWGDQRLDLGTISSLFGIEPATLKLNGHFISRGLDLIASSVTWDSLVSFFSSKGLSTGVDSSTALLVDGKLSRVGSKRTHEPSEVDRGVHCCIQQCEEGVGVDRYSRHGEINAPNSKKLKSNAFGWDSQTSGHCDTGLKRRPWVEDTSPLKRVRASGSYSYENSLGRGVNDGSGPSGIPRLHCGYQISENMKRLRDDEVIVAVSCKKTR